jgi:hypothetical protein
MKLASTKAFRPSGASRTKPAPTQALPARVRAGGDAPGARDRARTAEDGRAVKFHDAAEIAAVDIGGQAETEILRRGWGGDGQHEGRKGRSEERPCGG